MVVGNLHVVCVPILPDETDAVLVVDADAVLPFPGAFQNFQTVAGNRCRVAERSRLIQMDELTERSLFDGPKLLRGVLQEYPLSLSISIRLNHESLIYRYPINCKAEL